MTTVLTLDRQQEQDVLFGVINRFIGYFTHDAQRRTGNDTSQEYPFVPMDTRQIFDQLVFASDYLQRHRNQPEMTLIDIGCGIGNVLLFAEQLHFSAFGIEKDAVPCALAQQLMGPDRVTTTDICDFTDYDRYDVIYYFRPFHLGERERRFERTVEEQMRVGALLIANRKMSDAILRDQRFTRLHREMPIWEKIAA